MKFCINFFCCPGKSCRVLAHFKCGSSNTTGISCFTRHKCYTVCHKVISCLAGSRHICTFCNIFASVCNKALNSIKVKFILSCAWKIDITFDVPDTFSFCISSAFYAICVFFDTSTFYFFDIFNDVKFDSFRIIDISVGVAHSNNFTAKFGSFLYCVDGNITGTCYDESFTGDCVVFSFNHFVQHIYKTISCSLCTNQRSTVGKTFTCENTLV